MDVCNLVCQLSIIDRTTTTTLPLLLPPCQSDFIIQTCTNSDFTSSTILIQFFSQYFSKNAIFSTISFRDCSYRCKNNSKGSFQGKKNKALIVDEMKMSSFSLVLILLLNISLASRIVIPGSVTGVVGNPVRKGSCWNHFQTQLIFSAL